MIVFDGVDIRRAAGVRIEDVRVSAIDLNPVSRARAIAPGAYFVRNRCGTRTVTVTFALLSDDRNQRQASLLAVSEWAKTDAEYKLELPGHPDHYLMAVCTAKPDPSTRQWWEAKLRLVFTTFDNPYLTSDDEIRAQCGTPFSIGGTAPPLIRITRDLSSNVSNQTYAANGQSMFFSTIPAGRMTIDLNKQTAQVGGTSIMRYFGQTSRFIMPVTGNITISGTGTVIYRERWV